MRTIAERRPMWNGKALMPVVFDDGGRADAGYKGNAGDCACRAIAVATGMPYQDAYDLINGAATGERRGSRKRGISSARNGVYKQTMRKLMERLGWIWTPTMHIGSGCNVRLAEGELPDGRLVVSLSKHYTTIIDGVIHDTHDPQRATLVQEGGVDRLALRCVYGYWSQA